MTPTEELERLAASITPGRWRKYGKMTGKVISEGPDVGTVEICETGDFRDAELIPHNADRWNADADAIALLPELLAENIDLRKKVALLEKRLASGTRVKPLEWERSKSKTSYTQANCILGQYQIAWLDELECWQLSAPYRPGSEWKEGFTRHEGKASAKAAAQADYEARVLSALEPATSESAEPVAWRARHSEAEQWHLFCYRPSWWEVQPLYTHPQPLTVEAAAQDLGSGCIDFCCAA